jgi:uncharacterized protein YcbK (DUF882 family)
MTGEMLSEHFSKKELECPHCGECKVDPVLIESLEKLRAEIGKPILVHSGYRCPEHNAAVGGAHGSEHMEGKAADISVEGMALWQLKLAAVQVPRFCQGGIGSYPEDGHLHVDVRATPARW